MNKTVLIVEDEPELREMLASTLKLEGYGVLEASNGQEAIDYLRMADSAQPNMILMDLMMPGMDGWAFRSEMLRDPLLAYIPIVVISGSSNVPRVAKSMRATAYLTKPFSMEELVHTVETHWLDDSIQKQHTRAVIETMQTMVHRLSNLIASLLQNAPFVEDRLLVKTEQLDIDGIITKIVEHHRAKALQNNTDLHVSIAKDIAPIYGDSEVVRLIINNLIEDSLNTMTGGDIKISVYADQDTHCIAVETSGGNHQAVSTMNPVNVTPVSTEDPHTMQNEPDDSARRTAPGVGVGLTLVREILASLQAHIELQSDPNGGNTFTLVLPELNQPKQARVV